MNVYRISYQAALDGEYRKEIDRYDPWGRYFDRMGATVYRDYADLELEIGSDLLQNTVNLIYSGRKHGIDEIRIALDHQQAQMDVIAHFYSLHLLPEVVAEFEHDSGELVLKVTFEEGRNTSSHRRTKAALDDVPDLDALFDNVEQEIADEKKRPPHERDPFSLGMEALGEAVKAGSRRKVTLPQWVIDKYRLSEDRADCSKAMADVYSGLANIFGRHQERYDEKDR